MSTLNNEIRDRVATFVEDLERLIRKQALDSVAAALGATPSSGGGSGSGSRGKAAAKAPKAPPPEVFGTSRKRRTAKYIDSLAASILDYVEKHPGLRSEKIKAALRIPAPDWNLPVKKLIEEGKMSTKGEKRATEYYAKKK